MELILDSNVASLLQIFRKPVIVAMTIMLILALKSVVLKNPMKRKQMVKNTVICILESTRARLCSELSLFKTS